MDNQHRKIAGYRELNQIEIDLVNAIKAHAEAGETLVARVWEHLNVQLKATVKAESDTPAEAEAKATQQARINAAEPGRWAGMGRTDLQTASMALTRAVTQPTTF